MINLLQETTEELMTHNKTWNDVLWIGCADFTISVENFKEVANKEYDNDYGAPKVAQDLKIVGVDWWLERYEYDGAEEWVYKSYPKKPLEQKLVKRVITSNVGWGDLAEIQMEEGNESEAQAE
jgi:hypothetical protein